LVDVPVDADYGFYSGVELALVLVGGVGYFLLGITLFYRRYYAAHAVDLVYVVEGLLFDAAREGFHEVASAEGVYRISDSAFLGDYLLRPERDRGGLFRREGERLVHGVRVEGLGASEDRSEGLYCNSGDVVYRLLRREARACRLGVGFERERLRVSLSDPVTHDLRPHAAGRPELGDLFEEVVVDVKEEGETRGEIIYVEAPLYAFLDVAYAVGDGERQLLYCGGARLTDVVAG